MNKEMLDVAIVSNKCSVVFDTEDVCIRYEYEGKEYSETYALNKKYTVDTIEDIVQETVDKCLASNYRVKEYLSEIIIMKTIFDNCTDIPDDVLGLDEIEWLVVNRTVSLYCDEDNFVTYFYNTLKDTVDVYREKYIHMSSVDGFIKSLIKEFNKPEIKKEVKELVEELKKPEVQEDVATLLMGMIGGKGRWMR